MARTLPLAVCALLAVALPSQRDLRVLTSDTEAKQDAQISPDGVWIVFRGANRLGVVAFAGGPPSPLVIAPNLGSFLWAPNSSGIYFVEANQVRFVARSGGVPRTIGTIPGTQARIWSVDAADKTLYGSRYDATIGVYHLYSLGTGGTTPPKDIVSSPYVLDGIKIDPSGAKILYRSYSPQPFTPRELFAANADGSGSVSLTNGPINGNLEDADWLDNGVTAGFNLQSPTFLPHLALVATGNPTVRFLTDGNRLRRKSSISANRRWWVCEVQYSAIGATVGVMPILGSGVVPLDTKKSWQFFGPPSIDATGRRVAFAGVDRAQPGTPQIVVGETDREFEITPRAVIGQPLTLELPLRAGEIGAMYVSGGLSGSPIQLPGLIGEFALDLTMLLPLISGVGNGSQPLKLVAPLPSDAGFAGIDLFFQGIRFLGISGDFTRYAQVRTFQ